MGDGLYSSYPMKKPLLYSLLVFVAACGKGELDPAPLTTNPFDPDYSGADLFVFDTTYTELVTFPNGQFLYQVIAFEVREDLFLAPADYNVQVVDQENGSTTVVGPASANTSHFIYRRAEPVIGAPVCLQLSLINNGSTARAETICATL